MSVELLTYASLAEHLKCSPEAARSLTKRLQLPRSRSNDGKAIIAVDLAEIRHTPKAVRSTTSRRPLVAALRARIIELQAKITELEDEAAKLEIVAADQRTDFEQERVRADALMIELLKATAETMAAKETTARLEGELAAQRPTGLQRSAG